MQPRASYHEKSKHGFDQCDLSGQNGATPEASAPTVAPKDHKPARKLEDDYDFECADPDNIIRLLIVIFFFAYVCKQWSDSHDTGESFDLVQVIKRQVVVALAYWSVGMVVKFADDILDEENHKMLIRVVNDRSQVSSFRRRVLLAALALFGCVSAFLASLSPVAAIMMTGEVIGCLVVCKIDAPEHAAVMLSMLVGAALQWKESQLAPSIGEFFGFANHESRWGAVDFLSTMAILVAASAMDEGLRAIVKSRRKARAEARKSLGAGQAEQLLQHSAGEPSRGGASKIATDTSPSVAVCDNQAIQPHFDAEESTGKGTHDDQGAPSPTAARDLVESTNTMLKFQPGAEAKSIDGGGTDDDDDEAPFDWTVEGLFEELANGRYLVWLSVLLLVVVGRGWYEHMLVLAAQGYEDAPKMYSFVESAVTGGMCGLKARGTPLPVFSKDGRKVM